MKILYIIHVYWPNYQAGSENYTHYLAQEMESLGHDVSIFTMETLEDNSYSVKEYDEDGVSVFKVYKNSDDMRSIEQTYFDTKLDSIFENIFKRINPDIVHIQHLRNMSINMTNIINLYNIPIVFTLHDLWLECLNGKKLRLNGQMCLKRSVEECSKCLSPALFITNKSIFDKIYLKIDRLSGHDKKKRQKGVMKRNNVMKQIISKVNLFISPSKYIRDEFIKWGIPKEKIIYSRNGMKIIKNEGLLIKNEELRIKNEKNACNDDGCEEKIPGQCGEMGGGSNKELGIKNGNVKFVFTSHIQKLKGIDVLIEACEILQRRSINNVYVELYGGLGKNEKYNKEFNNKINKLKNVKYKGAFQNTDINKILSDVDYLILPSIWPENAPLVIDEAYLNNIPCIVSNIGGMAERVDDGKNGLHFKVGDAKDLADKMEYVSKNTNIRERFVKNIPHVKTIEENAKELERIYESMV